MGFISNRRTALWVGGMERWAQKEVREHTEDTVKGKKKVDRHGMYCLGVISAITIAKGEGSRRTSMPKDRDQRQGRFGGHGVRRSTRAGAATIMRARSRIAGLLARPCRRPHTAAWAWHCGSR